MTDHLLLPVSPIESCINVAAYSDWLEEWLETVSQQIDNDEISASLCLQGCLTEIALSGAPRRNWIDIFDALLLNESRPIAYSANYTRKLYRFDDQGIQSTVHAIHTRWWLEKVSGRADCARYGEMISELTQPDGWIYNPRVSPTVNRLRMRSERFMNLAMGIAILLDCGILDAYVDKITGAIAQEPMTTFVSPEYFRSYCLQMLNKPHFEPAGFESLFANCRAGQAYCDFSPADKRDEYMGTRTRVSRDLAVHSPLASVQVGYLSHFATDVVRQEVVDVLRGFGQHLANDPLDIPAFTIRDLKDIPFGTDISPVEIISAAKLIRFANNIDTDLIALPGKAQQ